MSAAARYGAALVIGLAVTTWAWLHGPFDGANVLVIAILLAAAGALRIREHPEAQRDAWIVPEHRRGDGR